MNVRQHVHAAHREDQLRIQHTQLAAQLRDQFGRGKKGILPHIHRRGSGVVRFACHLNLIAGHAHDTVDQADGEIFFFQHRSLLDMQLQIGRCFLKPVRSLPRIPARFQRFRKCRPFRVLLLQHLRPVKFAGQHAGSHH
ncbi:hypothetical protein D3C87_1727510 [compost metagenome]